MFASPPKRKYVGRFIGSKTGLECLGKSTTEYLGQLLPSGFLAFELFRGSREQWSLSTGF